MESTTQHTVNNDTSDNNNQPATPERQTMAPIFDAKQKEHVNKIVDKVTRKLEAKHRAELAELQKQRDNAANLSESELLTRYKQERDAAQERLRSMERARSETIAAAKFTRAWNDAGLVDNPEWRDSMRRVLTKVDDDGELVLLDTDGKERFGVDLPAFMKDLGEQLPRLRSGAEDATTPRIPSGSIRSKDDLKTYKEKSGYITKFGYDAWEKLPAHRVESATQTADDPLNWSNDKKGAFIREHGALALSQKLEEARARKRKGGFKG